MGIDRKSQRHTWFATYVELAKGVDNGTVTFAGERGQRKDRHAHRDILGELCEAAKGAAHGRGLGCVDHDRQRHADDYHQQIGQGQGEDVTVIEQASRLELRREWHDIPAVRKGRGGW